MNKFVWKTIGHERIINFLEKSIDSKKLSHAYLFYGPKKIGKNYLANRFARILQCQNDKERPCGRCLMCQQIKKNIHPDIYSVIKEEDKKNISISQVRELQQKLGLSSFTNSYKIAIINKAETLSWEARDSLLKTLEEPAPKTIIILITNQISQIPETITSRSQVLRFNQVPIQKIQEYLEHEEKIEKNQAQTLAHLSFGRIGQAMNFIQDPQSFIGYKKQVADFINLLNSNPSEKLKFIEKNNNQKDTFLQTVQKHQTALQVWGLIIRDLFLLKLNQENLVNTFAIADLNKLKNSFNLSQLKSILQKIEETKKYLKMNISPKLALENLLLHI